MFYLDDCIALIASRSSKVFIAALEKRLRPYNMTRIQWFALYYIHVNSPITQRELADLMDIREPAVVRLIHEMELQELLSRSCSSADRRVRYLALTEEGERLYQEGLPIVEQFKDDAVAGISQEYLDILTDTLAKMVNNVKDG